MCKKIKLQRLHHTTYTNQTGQDLNVNLKDKALRRKFRTKFMWPWVQQQQKNLEMMPKA